MGCCERCFVVFVFYSFHTSEVREVVGWLKADLPLAEFTRFKSTSKCAFQHPRFEYAYRRPWLFTTSITGTKLIPSAIWLPSGTVGLHVLNRSLSSALPLKGQFVLQSGSQPNVLVGTRVTVSHPPLTRKFLNRSSSRYLQSYRWGLFEPP